MSGMLAISKAMSIAIHLCLCLAESKDHFCSTKEVAKKCQLSIHHLAKIVQKLVKAGIVKSIRGSQGGVQLLKPSHQITLASLMDILDDYQMSGCLLSPSICQAHPCALGHWMQEENKKISAMMQKTTIKDILLSLKHMKNDGQGL